MRNVHALLLVALLGLGCIGCRLDRGGFKPRGCWLRDPDTYPEWCSLEWLRMPAHTRDGWVSWLKKRNGNSLFIVLSHTKAGISPYRHGFSGEFDDARIKEWQKSIARLCREGIVPVLCFFDDHGPFHAESNRVEHRRFAARMIEAFGSLPVEWCSAHEPEEYWSTEYQDEFARVLHALGAKRVWVHSTRDTFLTEATDGLLHELCHPMKGRQQTPEHLRDVYGDMVERHPGKPVVAWEWSWYTEDADGLCRKQARACLDAGCAGVGQW